MARLYDCNGTASFEVKPLRNKTKFTLPEILKWIDQPELNMIEVIPALSHKTFYIVDNEATIKGKPMNSRYSFIGKVLVTSIDELPEELLNEK